MTLYILGSSLLIAGLSLVGIIIASLNEAYLRRGLVVLVSLSLGAFLGDAFIHLIPEALETTGNVELVALITIFGILLSFVAEKVLGWHHGHGHDDAHPEDCLKEGESSRIHSLGKMVLLTDSIHNFVDGIIIGASFMVSTEVGIASAVAIALHEIPQEIGDFGLLLYAGYKKTKALWLNFISALSVVLGASVFLVLGDMVASAVPYILPFAAGTFIYVAASDLIPELHKRRGLLNLLVQLVFIVVGVIAMYGLVFFE